MVMGKYAKTFSDYKQPKKLNVGLTFKLALDKYKIRQIYTQILPI